VVAGLLERELIEEAGRGDGLGAPVLYRTTTTFERIFGLEEGLGGLPGLDGHPELESAELRQRLHAVAAERG
jgi:chromosome segregation and condensation protein ScpB